MGQTTGQGPSTYEDELNGTYNKIHKTLAQNNKNKDVRMQVKEQLDERLENQLSIGQNLTINPVRNFSFKTVFSASNLVWKRK